MESIQKLFLGNWKVRYKFHSVAGMIAMAIFMAVVYLKGDNISSRWFVEEEAAAGKNKDFSLAGCDLFSGEWVFDNKSYPLYWEKQCPFMTDDYACEKFGRKDFKYQYWKWKPHGCDLPRFNGRALLEKLRDKRVVFVGDSLGKNQWVSLLCLVDKWIPDPSKKFSQWHGSLITFNAIEYNVSIDFYWEPLLVESNCDDPVNHRVRNRIMKIESIEKHAKNWIDADLLVFDSYTWWFEPNMTLVWGSFEKPDRVQIDSRKVQRYEMALKTWSDWLDVHVNRTKTHLFFMSLSPYHKRGDDWGKNISENCYNETEPILEKEYWGSGSDIEMMRTTEAAVQNLVTKGLKVQILNVTQLSDYRKEGHPSIYKRHWVPPTEMEVANPTLFSDCVHWCLPGVPDVWNQILYSYILHR